jgi:predicted transcriptional regulator
MAKFTIELSEEVSTFLKTLAEKKSKSPEEVLLEIILPVIDSQRVSIAVEEFKSGALTAKEAWKLSGLSFAEFLQVANR